MAISASHLDLWLHWIRTKTRTPLVALFKSISGQTRQTDLITVWISEQLRSSKINKEIWILGTTSIFDPLWKWLEPVRRHWQHSTNRNKLHIHSTSNKLLLACLARVNGVVAFFQDVVPNNLKEKLLSFSPFKETPPWSRIVLAIQLLWTHDAGGKFEVS